MLIFYDNERPVRVHLDLDICEDTYKPKSTNNPFPDLIEIEKVTEFDRWCLPNDIYMTVPQLYSFCSEWYELTGIELPISFDEWFKLYLNSEIDALKSEEYDLTYYDSMKLFNLTKYLKQNNYKSIGINPVKPLKGNKIVPELSWMLSEFFKGNSDYNKKLTELALENYKNFKNYTKKITHLCPELIPNAKVFLNEIFSVENIDFKQPRAIMYFVNPFTLTDSKTNYLFIRKLIGKVGEKYETNYCLYDANIPL